MASRQVCLRGQNSSLGGRDFGDFRGRLLVATSAAKARFSGGKKKRSKINVGEIRSKKSCSGGGRRGKKVVMNDVIRGPFTSQTLETF
jgi:hypothetical protein